LNSTIKRRLTVYDYLQAIVGKNSVEFHL